MQCRTLRTISCKKKLQEEKYREKNRQILWPPLKLLTCNMCFWPAAQGRSLLNLLPCFTLVSKPTSYHWTFMLHLLLGSPSINPSGEQNSGPTFWDKGLSLIWLIYENHPHIQGTPLARHLTWYLPQITAQTKSLQNQGGGMEEWCSVHHIFHPRWCFTCRLVCGSVVKLGLDADWGWVPLHSAPLTFLVREKVSRTRGGKKAIEEDTPQERCRDIQPWPEWCWSKGDVAFLPVARELRRNPRTEEGSMQGVCWGAGATFCCLHLILMGSYDPSALHPRRSLKQEILLRSLQ